MIARESFGPALRCERERRGISLQAIADATKISAALFAAMERNDFSRWPEGIFRRSFLRAYAQAIGLDADRTVQQYLHAFHARDDGGPAPRPSRAHAHPVRALAAFAIARLTAALKSAARLFSRRPAPPVAAPLPRHVTKRRSRASSGASRRHRSRRSDRRRPRA